jgi:hypothetical protein
MYGRRFLLHAPDATGNADGGAGGAGDDAGKPNDGAGAAAAAGVRTFTQEELDKIVSSRVERAKAETKQAIEDEAKKAAMSAEDKLKQEIEALKRANEATTKAANERILRTEAKLQLTSKGYSPEQAAILMRAIDLSGVDVDGAGEFDSAAVTAAIDEVAKVMPPAIQAAGTERSGPDFKGEEKGKRVYTKAEIAAMSPEEYAAAEKDIDAAMAEPGHPRIRD